MMRENEMICEYDYTCPHCGETHNSTSNTQAPEFGEIIICPFCKKKGKIIYEKVVYEVEKARE